MTGAIVALALVLAVASHQRGLALFAYLLLLGGAALTALVWLTARANPVADEVFWEPSPVQALRIPQFDEIAREVETVLELGSDADGKLRTRLQIVAGARLADRHGIELDGYPEQSRAAIDDELAWLLVRNRERLEWVELPALGAAELDRIIASLERL
ncbi:MAG TPA: hypothetical protein VFU99_05630 [Gaiellaceae bacterium]|nr:hypothetical protein [Gaiellaceae bacterium]